MSISDDAAAAAAATLTAAIIQAQSGMTSKVERDEAVPQVLDIYRRSLRAVAVANVVESKPEPKLTRAKG